MENRSVIQRQLAQKIGFSLMLGIFGWVSLLVKGAAALRDQTESATYDVLFGPLVLNRISRQKTDDGFTATFSFENGLLWYLLCCLLIGLLLGIVFTRLHSGKQTK